MWNLLARSAVPPALCQMSSHSAQKHISKFVCIEPPAHLGCLFNCVWGNFALQLVYSCIVSDSWQTGGKGLSFEDEYSPKIHFLNMAPFSSPSNMKNFQDHIILDWKTPIFILLFFKQVYILYHNSWHSYSHSTFVRQLPKSIPGNLPVSLVMFGFLEIKWIYETWHMPIFNISNHNFSLIFAQVAL